MPRPEFNPAEFAATLNRIKEGKDMENPKPDFDPALAREHKLAAMGGRNPDTFEQALRYHHFFFVPAHKLTVLPGSQVPTEGMWYHRGLRFAFSPSSLAMEFPGGPESFDQFIRQQKQLTIQNRERDLVR